MIERTADVDQRDIRQTEERHLKETVRAVCVS